jgi:outer membrane lipoprotein LolB
MIKYLGLIFFLFLTSCATLPPPSSEPLKLSWEERKQALQKIDTWKLRGAIAIHTPGESGSASLNWQQKAQTYTISLFGPLGTNAVQINGQPGLVTLRNSQGQEFQATSPEQLLYNQLGWRLPVSHLYYWTRGLPVPSLPAQKAFDPYNRLSRLTQANWQVWFKQYGVFNQQELPTKIVLTHPQLNIKLIIYQWGS